MLSRKKSWIVGRLRVQNNHVRISKLIPAATGHARWAKSDRARSKRSLQYQIEIPIALKRANWGAHLWPENNPPVTITPTAPQSPFFKYKYHSGNGRGKSGNLKPAESPKKWITEKKRTPRQSRISEVGRCFDDKYTLPYLLNIATWHSVMSTSQFTFYGEP